MRGKRVTGRVENRDGPARRLHGLAGLLGGAGDVRVFPQLVAEHPCQRSREGVELPVDTTDADAGLLAQNDGRAEAQRDEQRQRVPDGQAQAQRRLVHRASPPSATS